MANQSRPATVCPAVTWLLKAGASVEEETEVDAECGDEDGTEYGEGGMYI